MNIFKKWKKIDMIKRKTGRSRDVERLKTRGKDEFNWEETGLEDLRQVEWYNYF
jgi:hypothetical protein